MSKKERAGLITERLAAQRYSVTTRTLMRWDAVDPNWPKPIYIRKRRYRSVAALDKFDQDNARKPVVHSPHWSEGQPRAKRGRFKKLAKIEKKTERKPAKRSLDHHES